MLPCFQTSLDHWHYDSLKTSSDCSYNPNHWCALMPKRRVFPLIWACEDQDILLRDYSYSSSPGEDGFLSLKKLMVSRRPIILWRWPGAINWQISSMNKFLLPCSTSLLTLSVEPQANRKTRRKLLWLPWRGHLVLDCWRTCVFSSNWCWWVRLPRSICYHVNNKNGYSGWLRNWGSFLFYSLCRPIYVTNCDYCLLHQRLV